MRIAITNHSGARNRGSEALVQVLATELRASGLPITALDLHSGDREFDQWRFGDRMRVITATALKINRIHTRNVSVNRVLYRAYAMAERLAFGAASHRADFSGAMDADLIVSTGGDNFSSDYNSLVGHCSYLQLGRPVYLCGQSIGPFPAREEAYFKASLQNVRLVTARETITYEYMKQLGLSCPIEQTADVAFLLPTLDRSSTLEYAQRFLNASLDGRKLAGLSASGLVAKYFKHGREEGVRQVAAFVDSLNDMGYSVLVLPHVMELSLAGDDLYICTEVLRHTRSPDANILLNGLFSSIEAKSLIGLCEVLIGARTHTTIASLSQGIPTVAIAYSRKAYGIMEDYYGDDSRKLIIPAAEVATERLMDATKVALAIGRKPDVAARMKTLAKRNFDLLVEAWPSMRR